MAVTTLTDVKIIAAGAYRDPEGASPLIHFRQTWQGKDPDGNLIQLVIETASDLAPNDNTSWVAWYGHDVKDAFTALDYGIPSEPPFNPYPA